MLDNPPCGSSGIGYGQFEKIVAHPKIFLKDGLWCCTDSYVTKYRRIEWGPGTGERVATDFQDMFTQRKVGAHIEIVDRIASGGRGVCCIVGWGLTPTMAYEKWYHEYLPYQPLKQESA